MLHRFLAGMATLMLPLALSAQATRTAQLPTPNQGSYTQDTARPFAVQIGSSYRYQSWFHRDELLDKS